MKTNLLSRIAAVLLLSVVVSFSANAQRRLCVIGDATRYG
jgi:hypothetical protein